VIFSDLAKASDGINHEILLAKLHFYEIWGISEDWVRSHLTNRRQKVEVKSPNTSQYFFCDWCTLKHGVPQGSILGSLLFVICINDFSLRINSISQPVLFADDTSKFRRFLFSVKFNSPSYYSVVCCQ
jgi:hypothetical protein